MFQSALASVRCTGLHQSSNETVDPHLHPLFRTNFASDSLLNAFKVDGNVPGRKTWNLEQAQDRLGATLLGSTFRAGEGAKSTCTFALKTLSNRDWKLAKSDAKKRAKGVDPLAPEPRPISEARASLADGEARASLTASASAPDLFGPGRSRTSSSAPEGVQDTEKAPLKRADKYYQALLKAEKARNELVRREAWEEFTNKAERAAAKAKKKALKAELQADQPDGGVQYDSESEEEEDEDDEELEDPGPLQPYPGLMKVEVEVVVLRAPGVDKSETESSVDDKSTHTPSSASARSDDDGIDWAKELQELQEELAEKEKVEDSETSSLPDGLGGRTIGTVYDNSDKRTALGLGGTAFFVPEVERYAHAPSLLPPPPRGEGHLQRTGHKRLKLKPRLPLEVSRHRWRDEHPYGCPVEDEYTPDMDALRSWEEKVRRVELYGTLNKFFTSMPKPDGIRKLPKTDTFEKTLDWELRNSLPWQQYIKRQRLIEIARTERGEKQKNQAQSIIEGYTPGKPQAAKPGKPGATEKPAGEVLTETEKPKPGKGIYKPEPEKLPPHPGPPGLKMSGPPPFQAGVSPRSPPSSHKKRGLMSVAPGVRKGMQ